MPGISKARIRATMEFHNQMERLETVVREIDPKHGPIMIDLRGCNRTHAPVFELLTQLGAMRNPSLNAMASHLTKEQLSVTEHALVRLRGVLYRAAAKHASAKPSRHKPRDKGI
ncbi:MAG: hypothetical protein KGH94_05190 [Candidatus Micrarchaeota archaeon]|nr:hypothetical protein [Candidatus Micrarchaeota archaeon]